MYFVEKIQVPEEISNRSCHSSIVYNDAIYYFGGHFETHDDQTNILTIFHPKLQNWKEIKPKKKEIWPSKRCSHSSNLYKNKMVIYGGGGGKTRSSEFFLNDLWTLNLENIEEGWLKLTSENEGRDSHTASIWNDNLIIFGGHNRQFTLGDVAVYNFVKNQWKSLEPTNKGPGPRTRHSNVIHHDKLFIFGGFRMGTLLNDLYCLDLNFNSWNEIKIDFAPSVRRSHMVEKHQHFMYTVGGFNGVDTFDSIHRLDLDLLKWENCETFGSKLPKRGVGSLKLFQNRLILFGGNFELEYFNDMYGIHLFLLDFQLKLKNCKIYKDVVVKFDE
jgi:hypothetical protein